MILLQGDDEMVEKQYEYYQETFKEHLAKIDKAFASVLLTLPLKMDYDTWVILHKIKGDYE